MICQFNSVKIANLSRSALGIQNEPELWFIIVMSFGSSSQWTICKQTSRKLRKRDQQKKKGMWLQVNNRQSKIKLSTSPREEQIKMLQEYLPRTRPDLKDKIERWKRHIIIKNVRSHVLNAQTTLWKFKSLCEPEPKKTDDADNWGIV